MSQCWKVLCTIQERRTNSLAQLGTLGATVTGLVGHAHWCNSSKNVLAVISILQLDLRPTPQISAHTAAIPSCGRAGPVHKQHCVHSSAASQWRKAPVQTVALGSEASTTSRTWASKSSGTQAAPSFPAAALGCSSSGLQDCHSFVPCTLLSFWIYVVRSTSAKVPISGKPQVVSAD